MRKEPTLWLAIAAMLLVSSMALSQYEYRPYSGKPNAVLKNKVHSGKVGSLFKCNLNDGFYEEWATSTLRAEGKPPKELPWQEDDGESMFAHAEWTCMYSAHSAMDGNSKTAWAEGAPGDGVGEIVIVEANTRKPVRIWAGFGKSPQAFRNNNRPKLIRVYVLDGKFDLNKSTERGDMISDIRVAAKGVVTLRDLNGYQPLALPRHFIRPKSVGLIAVEILSVYPGSKYHDTCISEIGN